MQSLIPPLSFLCLIDFQTWSYRDIFIGSKAIVLVYTQFVCLWGSVKMRIAQMGVEAGRGMHYYSVSSQYLSGMSDN